MAYYRGSFCRVRVNQKRNRSTGGVVTPSVTLFA